MTPAEAAQELVHVVSEEKLELADKMLARLPRAANELRNAELAVLSGNASPSPPGSPPGRRSGVLRDTWTIVANGYATFGVAKIVSGAYYSGFLENGTSKMAARPYVDKIQQKALPKIMSIMQEIGG